MEAPGRTVGGGGDVGTRFPPLPVLSERYFPASLATACHRSRMPAHALR